MDSLTPHLTSESTVAIDHYGDADQSVFVAFFLVFRESSGHGQPPGRPTAFQRNGRQRKGLPWYAKGRW